MERQTEEGMARVAAQEEGMAGVAGGTEQVAGEARAPGMALAVLTALAKGLVALET